MSKINLTREDSFKTREKKGTSKLSTTTTKSAVFMFPSALLIQFVSSMYKRLEPHLASSHDNRNKKLVEHEECHVSQALAHLLLMPYNFMKQTRTHINLHTFL